VARDGRTLGVRLNLEPAASAAMACVLLRPAPQTDGKAPQSVVVKLDGQLVEPLKVEVPGKWAWLAVPVAPGVHALEVVPAAGADGQAWSGSAAVWVVGDETVEPVTVVVRGSGAAPPARPLPSTGRGARVLPRSVRIGETRLGPEAAR